MVHLHSLPGAPLFEGSLEPLGHEGRNETRGHRWTALPRDAILMELGRAYAAAGKKADARQTFDKVVAEFPDSAFADEAKTLITSLT